MPSIDVPSSLPGVADVRAVIGDLSNPAEEPAFQLIRKWLGVRSAWLDYLNLGDMLHTPKCEPQTGITASAWKSPNGGLALFFSNTSDQPQEVTVDLSRYSSKLKWKAYLNERKPLAKVKGKAATQTLAPDDTLVVEGK
jgi:hypothetical protein